ncbi:hypothetical protein [uncultured Victivallis sp.]|uniref:hypothetical protein n=1 Tax=uncultured Victivallis sp. TaxID=354118 RepID=UPI002592905D|nr:hypothetical protein [uncultured Victivallis sp.]
MTDQEVELFYNRLQPAAWSTAAQMSPRERVNCFFFYRVDDLDVVTAAHKSVFEYIFGGKSLEESRTNWWENSGFQPSNELIECYNATAYFYNGLYRGIFQYQNSIDPDIIEHWPNFELVGCSACGFKKLVVDKRSGFAARHYPPCNFTCDGYAEDSERKAQKLPPETDCPERFCNPVDLYVALCKERSGDKTKAAGLRPAKRKSNPIETIILAIVTAIGVGVMFLIWRWLN